jgi:hypothetical protein
VRTRLWRPPQLTCAANRRAQWRPMEGFDLMSIIPQALKSLQNPFAGRQPHFTAVRVEAAHRLVGRPRTNGLVTALVPGMFMGLRRWGGLADA